MRTVAVTRVSAAGAVATKDDVAVEEPLEIRISGDTIAVTMRTPGHDRELALGFLFAEGIIASRADVSGIAHCGRTGTEERENVIEVTPAPGATLKLPEDSVARRGTLMSSACGVCGRKSIDDLLARVRPVVPAPVSRARILGAVETLRTTQPVFAKTGGCHGAALVTLAGEHLCTFEDVGRHNAVDKLVGSRVLTAALPLSSCLLVVSGRLSFEIVQKAVAAGLPVVVGISAASSLAVDVATRAGVTLCGFVRGDALVVYTGRVEDV